MLKQHIHAIENIDINTIESAPLRHLPPISFTNDVFCGINLCNHEDPIVVSIIIANFMVGKVLKD